MLAAHKLPHNGHGFDQWPFRNYELSNIKKNKIMKNTLSRLMNKGHWLNLMLAAVLFSCTNIEDPCQYEGNQIVEKNSALVGRWFKFRKDGNITERVYVLEFDWEHYNLGDTLHCR